jgi:3-hydroxyacyl-CoA dehydrogenase
VWRLKARSARAARALRRAGAAQGVGSAEDIDKGMVLGTAHKMGPLHLADFIGAPPALVA